MRYACRECGRTDVLHPTEGLDGVAACPDHPAAVIDSIPAIRLRRGRPRLPDAKTPFTVRASPGRWADLDARAQAAGVDRRTFVDRLLWPATWEPAEPDEPLARDDDPADYGAAEVASALDAGERRGGR